MIFFSPLKQSISCSLFFSLHNTTVCCSQACGRMQLKQKCLRGRDERSGEYSEFRQLKKEEKHMLTLDVIFMLIRATQLSKSILKHNWKKFQNAACHNAVFEWRLDAMILSVYLMHYSKTMLFLNLDTDKPENDLNCLWFWGWFAWVI